MDANSGRPELERRQHLSAEQSSMGWPYGSGVGGEQLGCSLGGIFLVRRVAGEVLANGLARIALRHNLCATASYDGNGG